jgi:hypothetical protein
VFEDSSGDFVVTIASPLDFDANTLGGMEVRVSHAGLNVSNRELSLLETGLDSQEFDHDNSLEYDDSAFGPSAWNYSPEAPEPLAASTEGGEFHPYLLQLLGPSELLDTFESLRDPNTGEQRAIFQAFDGNYYLKRIGQSSVADVLLAKARDEIQGYAELKLQQGICLWNISKGFYDGGVSLVSGTVDLIQFLNGVAGVFNPRTLIIRTLQGEEFVAEKQFLQTSAQTVQTLAAAAVQIQQDQDEIILAAITGDWDAVKHISEPYRLGFEWAAELLVRFKNELSSLELDRQCYWTGRALFEIAGLAAAYTKASQASKLAYLNDLKAKPLYTAEIGGSTRFKTALDNTLVALERLGTTKMCFAPGTKVHSDHGFKNIEDIQRGGWVLARDVFSGRQAYKPVTETIVTYPSRLYHVIYRSRQAHRVGNDFGQLEGSSDSDSDGDDDFVTLVCTGEHPFFVPSKGEFVPADALSVGNDLLLADGRHAEIVSIQVEDAPEGQTFTTYNLAVEDYHTYFVGEHGIWVHNTADRVCARILSVYLRKVKKQGANPHPWQAFEELADQLPNATGRALYPALGEASHDAYVLADTANDVSKAPSVKQVRNLLKGREGLDQGEYITRKGKTMPNQIETHHGAPEYLQKNLKLQGKGLGVDIDDCPGLPTTLAKHRGKDPFTIHKKIEEKLPIGGRYDLDTIKTRLQQAYDELGLSDLGRVVVKWLDTNYGP